MAGDGESQAIGDAIIKLVKQVLSWFKFVLIGVTRLLSIKRLFLFVFFIGIGLVISSYREDIVGFIENLVLRQNSELEIILINIFSTFIKFLPLIIAFFYLIHIGKLKIERKKFKMPKLKLPKRNKTKKVKSEEILNSQAEDNNVIKESNKEIVNIPNNSDNLIENLRNEFKKEIKDEIKNELKEEFNNS
jgi:hypothetical protein